MNNWEEQFNKTYDWLIAEYQGDCEDIKALIHKVEKEAYERGIKHSTPVYHCNRLMEIYDEKMFVCGVCGYSINRDKEE